MRMLHEDPRDHASLWMAPGLEKCLKLLQYATCQNMVRSGNLSSLGAIQKLAWSGSPWNILITVALSHHDRGPFTS